MEDIPSSIKDLVFEFLRRNILFAVLICIGLILSGIGLYQYIVSKNATDIEFVNSDASTDVLGENLQPKDITVDVAGEVKNPGVFVLKEGARLKDAIESAGGFTEKADSEYISKRLNLAQKISDGGKIYIPAVGETAFKAVTGSDPVTGGQVGFTGESSSLGTDINSLININSASESQLDTLPKVGPVTAKKIIDGRPYMTIEELVSKKVMTQKTFEGLKDRVTVQ